MKKFKTSLKGNNYLLDNILLNFYSFQQKKFTRGDLDKEISFHRLF